MPKNSTNWKSRSLKMFPEGLCPVARTKTQLSATARIVRIPSKSSSAHSKAPSRKDRTIPIGRSCGLPTRYKTLTSQSPIPSQGIPGLGQNGRRKPSHGARMSMSSAPPAAGWWLCCRGKDADYRCASDRVLVTSLVSSALPHLLKVVFDQERPDRRTIRGYWRGIPFSGKRLDAFPSGHAVHIGALASVASRLPAKQGNVIWSLGAGLVLTRIVLLAHWTSDVAVGLAIGVLTERLLRKLTGYGSRSRSNFQTPRQVRPGT